MKSAVAIFLLLCFAACVSSKKTTHTDIKKTDTASSFVSKSHLDTTSIVSVKKATSMDITYYYDTARETKDTASTPAASPEPFEGGYSFVPHQGLLAVTVHVNQPSDSTVVQNKITSADTVHKQRTSTEVIGQTVVQTKTTLPVWLYIAGGLFLLLVVFIIILKIVK